MGLGFEEAGEESDEGEVVVGLGEEEAFLGLPGDFPDILAGVGLPSEEWGTSWAF